MVKVVRLLNDDGDDSASTICSHTLLSGPLLQTSSKTMEYNYFEWCLGVLAGPDAALLIPLNCYHAFNSGKIPNNS